MVSTFTGGCFFGAALAGWYAYSLNFFSHVSMTVLALRTNDRFGRKLSIQLGATVALWGCAMQAGANSFATMIVGRIVAGFAIGYVGLSVKLA